MIIVTIRIKLLSVLKITLRKMKYLKKYMQLSVFNAIHYYDSIVISLAAWRQSQDALLMWLFIDKWRNFICCTFFRCFSLSLSQRLANFSCKEPDNKYFKLCRPRGKIEDTEKYLYNKQQFFSVCVLMVWKHNKITIEYIFNIFCNTHLLTRKVEIFLLRYFA